MKNYLDPKSAKTPLRLIIILKPRDPHCHFSAQFEEKLIVSSSSQPICDAARVLHKLGYPDDAILIARHDGADHDAMTGPLGRFRKLRVRDDRGRPRFSKWDSFESRNVEARISSNHKRDVKPHPQNANTSKTPPHAKDVY